MLEFAAPLWLLGLPVIIGIWWLHRFRADPAAVSVSSLFLWKALERSRMIGGRVRKRADPIWLLRASITMLIILTLAQPLWTRSQSRIIVWFDTSLSMHATESDQPRWRSAARNVLDQLADTGVNDIRFRSLGHPGDALELNGEPGERWLEMIGRWFLQQPLAEPVWPAKIEMDQSARHWLVSDGASEGLADWLSSMPVTRVFYVGTTTGNVAVKRLAVRPSLVDGDRLQGLVAVANTGDQAVNRDLLLTVDDRPHSQWSMHLAPGQTLERAFRLQPAGKLIQVHLLPTDALTEDDRLELSTGGFGVVRYSVQGPCGPGLRAALTAHPRLQSVTDLPDLTVVCGESRPAAAGPTLFVHVSGETLTVAGVPQWTAEAGELRDLFLLRDWLAFSATESNEFSGEPILKLGDRAVIRYRRGPDPVIEVLLDMEHPTLVARPEYPVLVGGLIEIILQRGLLDPVTVTERTLAASKIRPRQMTLSPSGSGTAASRMSLPVQPYLLTLAVVLLVIDALFIFFRQRASGQTFAPSAGIS
jgi:hypothetical protein